jgi:hypothetical protein
MKPVGTKSIPVEQQLKTGYQAQGFALAQLVIASTISTAQQLRRAVDTAFDLDTKAREESLSVLNKWRKDLSVNAKGNTKGNTNLIEGGMDTKSLGRIARSATTRTSEFASILKAMDNGFSRDTLREQSGVSDIENIGFYTIVELARKFNQSSATGQGRPADPFEVKLAKWLARQQVTTKHDKKVKAKAMEVLDPILPHEEPAQA